MLLPPLHRNELVESDKDTFHAVILYQDADTGKRAKSIAARIHQEMEDERAFELDAWSITLLDQPVFFRMASEQAAEAEVIILSLADGNALTPRVKSWLKAWMDHKHGVCPALIALFVEEKDSSSIFAKRYLANAANRADMEFLCEKVQGEDASGLGGNTELCWIL